MLFWNVVYSLVVISAAPASFLGLPGGLLVFLATLVYALFTHFHPITGWLVLCFGILALVSETADNWAQAGLARRFGASGTGVMAAFAGSIMGALVLWPLLSLLFGALGVLLGPALLFLLAVVVPLLGALAGGWLGAYIAERMRGRSKKEALRAGWGATLGRTAGIFIKFGLTLGMIVAALGIVF